jgi:hypothetical protein
MSISLAKAQPFSGMDGFNSPEEWGAWTSERIAELELPKAVRGNVSVEFFGWVLPENDNKLLTISLGNSSQDILLKTVGESYTVHLSVSCLSNRLRFEIPVVRPSTSSRFMGVAISSVKISLQSGK